MNSDNEWQAASDNQTFSTINPATGEALCDFAHATKEDVDKAVKSARKAFMTTWGTTVPSADRGACESFTAYSPLVLMSNSIAQIGRLDGKGY